MNFNPNRLIQIATSIVLVSSIESCTSNVKTVPNTIKEIRYEGITNCKDGQDEQYLAFSYNSPIPLQVQNKRLPEGQWNTDNFDSKRKSVDGKSICVKPWTSAVDSGETIKSVTGDAFYPLYKFEYEKKSIEETNPN